ncbi:MAG: hypothetical protein KGI84_07745, partial [Elusimicrobia bacterium]|nr:hypothetical protein [Elusimicrobiota bacterium]
MGPLEERLISQLHRSVWEDVRIGRQTLVQYIAVLVSVLAVMGWGLKGACPNYTCSGPCPDRLLLATLVSQGALLWILFITIEGAYQYRVSQAISSAIERNHASEVFPKEASCACKRILPPGYYLFPPKFNLPELFQINFWAFYALFLSLPLIEAYFIRHAPHCRLTVVIAALLDILGLSLVAIQKFCKTFSGCCSKSCGSQEDALIALAVFAPFFVP